MILNEKMNFTYRYLLYIFIAILFTLMHSPLHAVKTTKAAKASIEEPITDKNALAIPPAVVSKFEKKAKRAIVFSAIGVGLVVAVVAILSLGTMAWALPVLGLAGVFANIGFIKAMRLRQQTKTRKKTFGKARFTAKTAIILSCVLGITLIFGLLSILLNQPAVF